MKTLLDITKLHRTSAVLTSQKAQKVSFHDALDFLGILEAILFSTEVRHFDFDPPQMRRKTETTISRLLPKNIPAHKKADLFVPITVNKSGLEKYADCCETAIDGVIKRLGESHAFSKLVHGEMLIQAATGNSTRPRQYFCH